MHDDVDHLIFAELKRAVFKRIFFGLDAARKDGRASKLELQQQEILQLVGNWNKINVDESTLFTVHRESFTRCDGIKKLAS